MTQPTTYHSCSIAVKRLLRQTLSYDEERIDVHSLAELLLAEGVRLQAGSSIKTDGEESDPWGLVAVIDIVRHKVCFIQSRNVEFLTFCERITLLSNPF